nr:fatty acid desaturase [Bacteriovorax sp. HI3]
MKATWKKFKTNPYFLPNYLGMHLIVVSVLIVLSLVFFPTDLSFKPETWHFVLIPFSMMFGIFVPTLMHNCVHGNLKIKPLNTIIGELCCFFVLMGQSIIAINHTLHHAHSDTENDPHNPANKSFMEFFFTALISGVTVIEETFYEFHGHTKKNQRIFKAATLMHYAGIFLKLTLWFLILGPTLFVFFFIPAIIAYTLAFAHINYITHVVDEHGEIQIINVDSNLYYKFINFIGSGVYYHKNHHLKPHLFNPKYMRGL